ncbi:hypothetical protein J007_03024 [Cryptococcus neoformans]|nr:hypothetical protein J007_03024 [Cryptococcus neoformans var. grubii]OXC61511.1 hypothetical protein C358_03106 [Cryptococcus neoformans var. grubii MW-RSA852]
MSTSPPAPAVLSQLQVNNVPPAAYYIPDFITEEEEEYLIRKIGQSPQPKWKTVGTGRRLQYWGGTVSKTGVLLPESLPDFFTKFPDIISRIEKFLQHASPDGPRLDINQVLVNEYNPGQGIAPHEDGPAFQPLVATISLGSHTVLDLHHYISSTSPSPPMIATISSMDNDSGNSARPVAAVPLAHLLLLPRSLLILSSSLYTSHLHAIAAKTQDSVKAGGADDGDVVAVANAELLGDPAVMESLRDGGVWVKERGVRTSLTFRHAQKVIKGGALGKVMGNMRRP